MKVTALFRGRISSASNDTHSVLCFLVFDKYMTISGFQIEETIDRETSGNLEQLLLAVGR